MAGFLITAASSGVGKTTVVTAVLGMINNVLPYKIGPDFIDPKFHEFITKEKSINLDAFIYDEKTLNYLFNYRNKQGYTKVIEGAMGLYGGMGHELDNCSTAHVSRILKVPVILIVNGSGKDTTLAAEILGLQMMDKRVNIQGVIVNKVNSEGSYKYLKEAIEKHTDVKCLGYLPFIPEIEFEERHLGLIQAGEVDDLEGKLKTLVETASKTIDIEAIKEISKMHKDTDVEDIFADIKGIHNGKTVAVAKDEAFTFMYNVHEEMFEKMGMTIQHFSPIKDRQVPNCDLLILPGGYPELYLEELYANKEMIESITNYINNGGKTFAECGGFIYLTKGMHKDDKFYPLVGIYDITIQMNKKLDIKRFGYLNVDFDGLKINGHEFHFSSIKDCNETDVHYLVTNKNYSCGFKRKNTIAGYPHLLYLSNKQFLIDILK